MAELSQGERRAGGCLLALVIGVVVVGIAVAQLNEISDVMINGSPRFSDDELRARPTLDALMPGYAGVVDAVAATVLAAEAEADEVLGMPGRRAHVPDRDDDPWEDDAWSDFSPESVRREEQVVDGRVVRFWSFSANLEGVLIDDPEVRAELRDDLLAAVASYGFRPRGSGGADDEPTLLDVDDAWGADLSVYVHDDLVVDVELRTGLHLSSGSEVVPHGDVRAPRRPAAGLEPV